MQASPIDFQNLRLARLFSLRRVINLEVFNVRNWLLCRTLLKNLVVGLHAEEPYLLLVFKVLPVTEGLDQRHVHQFRYRFTVPFSCLHARLNEASDRVGLASSFLRCDVKGRFPPFPVFDELSVVSLIPVPDTGNQL